MKAAVAGTFNVLHDGHKSLIDRVFDVGDEIFIGITTDRMSSSSRSITIPYYLREKAVREYASSKSKRFTIFPIEDMFGPKDLMSGIDILVVSEDKMDNGKKVQNWMKENFDKELELSVVPMKLKTDGSYICSTDILAGRCSRDGRMDAVDIAVGSLNPVKVEAVRDVMERVYGSVRIFPVDVKSGVSEQPFEQETKQGALNRAKAAIGDHTLSVGIEAGVFDRPEGLFDVQNCAICDKAGRITYGTGPGFRYPDDVAELVRKGMTVGEAMKKIYGDNIGRKQGAIGILSKGLLDRKELTEQAVIAAMIPRICEKDGRMQ